MAKQVQPPIAVPDADSGQELFTQDPPGSEPIQDQRPGATVQPSEPEPLGPIPSGEDPQTDDEPRSAEPRNDPRRFQFHQSRADRAEALVKSLEPYLPVVRYIQENPEVLDIVERDLKSRTSQYAAPSAPPAPPKPPERPKKPEGYNRAEAGTPDTPSWQYHQDLLEYNANFNDYMLQRDEYQDQVSQLQAAERARAEKAQQQMMGIVGQLQRDYGMTQDEAVEFTKFYNDPRYSLHQLVQVWRLEQSRGSQTPRPAGSPMGPMPAGVAPGGSGRLPNRPVDQSQIFGNDLIDEYRKVRMPLPTQKR